MRLIMSDDENTNEVEVTDTDTNFELAQGIVQNVTSDKPADAMDQVNDLMLNKVRDAIAGKREEIASSLFNTEVEPGVETEAEVEEPEVADEVETQEVVDTDDDVDGEVEEVEEVIETETEEKDEDVQTD